MSRYTYVTTVTETWRERPTQTTWPRPPSLFRETSHTFRRVGSVRYFSEGGTSQDTSDVASVGTRTEGENWHTSFDLKTNPGLEWKNRPRVRRGTPELLLSSESMINSQVPGDRVWRFFSDEGWWSFSSWPSRVRRGEWFRIGIGSHLLLNCVTIVDYLHPCMRVQSWDQWVPVVHRKCYSEHVLRVCEGLWLRTLLV